MVARAVEEYGRLDAVVQCAAVLASGSVTTIAPEGCYRVLDVDLSSAFLLGRAAVPSLIAAGGGSMSVNVTPSLLPGRKLKVPKRLPDAAVQLLVLGNGDGALVGSDPVELHLWPGSVR